MISVCSAAALDETSYTIPYVNETETCVEALRAPDSRYKDDNRGLSINIGWDENVISKFTPTTKTKTYTNTPALKTASLRLTPKVMMTISASFSKKTKLPSTVKVVVRKL